MKQSSKLADSQANEELRALYDSSVDGILIADADTQRFVRANPAICAMLGYSEEELLSMSVADIHPAESLPQALEAFEAQRQGRAKCARNTPCLQKQGGVIYVDITATRLVHQGRPCLVGFFRDVTERRQTQQALRESESKLRSLVENLPDLVFIIDQGANIVFVNRDSPDIAREPLTNACGFDFVAPEHQEACRRSLEQAFVTGLPQTVEVPDIFGHWWLSRGVPLAAESESPRLMVICTDITQQRTAAEAIHKEQRLLRQLLELHERERQLTAYELHDGFAQQLAGALFRLQGFREMHPRDPAAAWKDFDAAVQLIGRAIDEARRLISGLRPPILDESGIFEAIRYLACEHEIQGGPKIEFVHEAAFDRLAPPLETAVFRIVQESLQNACRHSHSDRVRVELVQHGDRIHIDVRDWGVGFDPETVTDKRFGLQGLRERVRLLGGRAVIESAPAKGTHIAVELPLVVQLDQASEKTPAGGREPESGECE